MNTRLDLIKTYLVLIAAVFMTACVPSVSLKSVNLPESAAKIAPINVGAINNHRPEGSGKADFSVVGKVRGGFGNPFALKTEKGRELDVALKEVLSSALMNVGYDPAVSVVNGAGKRLDMDVKHFWCDGYMGYRVSANIVLKLTDVKTGKIVFEKNIKASREFTLVGTYSALHKAFNEVVSELGWEMVNIFRSNEFKQTAN